METKTSISSIEDEYMTPSKIELTKHLGQAKGEGSPNQPNQIPSTTKEVNQGSEKSRTQDSSSLSIQSSRSSSSSSPIPHAPDDMLSLLDKKNFKKKLKKMEMRTHRARLQWEYNIELLKEKLRRGVTHRAGIVSQQKFRKNISKFFR